MTRDDAARKPAPPPIVVALEEEQTGHLMFQNRILDMLTRELQESRLESRAAATQIAAAVNRMGERFERGQRSLYLLAGLLVFGMLAAVGANFWLQYSKLSIGTGTAQTAAVK
jgi:hypothetical protein